jgi:hypothetical protein
MAEDKAMKSMLTIISIGFLFAFSTAYANIIYVPVQYPTIQEGINASSAGDTVLVDIGGYYENVLISSHDLTLASTFIISGDTAAITNTYIDGSNTATTVTIESNDPITVNVRGFTITHGLGLGNWPDVHGGGIHTGSNVFVIIDHCYFHDNMSTGDSNRGAGIYINSSYSRISNCVFYDNESRFGPAIAVGNQTNETVIDSCEMYDNTCTDANANNKSVISITYSYDITVFHCLIHHNNGTGVRNWGSYVTSVVNSTISGNGCYGIYNSYYNSNIYVQNSIVAFNYLESLFNNTQYNPVALCEYSDMVGGTGMPWFGNGCMDGDPMFADTLARDYSLAVGSPCIDAGDPASPLDPDGTVADMGAIYHDQLTDIEIAPELPTGFTLIRNYPNPFNAATTIEYVLTEATEVEISIYNMLGQRIETLFSGEIQAGEYSLIWNADRYPSGVYFARLQAAGISQNLKMVLLK